ncbi:LytR/AlgR family response regulator transcription factor [Mucilaginibacter sp.]
MDVENRHQGYNDLYFRIIVALIAAHIIVSFGAKESLFQLLITPDYYQSLLPSAVIAFLLVCEVYLVTIRLDKHYDWKEDTAKRIGLQLSLALILPAITAFLLATIYFGLFGYNILNTYYLQFDFPVIVIMLILLNVYYLAFYFYRQWQLTESRLLNMASKEDEPKNKEVFVVQRGAKNIPLPVKTICYFYHDGDFNFVRTFEKEDFLITQALDEVQAQLHEKQFFRVNRQMLINFKACEHFEPLEFGKLELFVTPPAKEQVIISQKRAKAFKEWIAR